MAKDLNPGDVVCLTGPLGAGKTLLTKGLCAGLGVKNLVNSPSFKIINEYDGKIPVKHIDLYRLNSAKEIDNLGLDDYIYGGGVTIIEWAEKLGTKNLPKKRVEIGIKMIGTNERLITWRRFR